MNRSHVCFGSGTGKGVVTAGGAGALYTKCFSVALMIMIVAEKRERFEH